jgi:acetyl-CoA C-acetyltransferase/potassium large conductance calcium-activated channel subfamily M alpha protein 1
MNLLAKSCFAPGLISLVSNLIASSGEIDDDEFDSDWSLDYAMGMCNEIYRTEIFETNFEDNFKFKDIAEIAHSQWGAIVFALEI